MEYQQANKDEITDEIRELKKVVDEQDKKLADQTQRISYLENIIALIRCNVYWKDRDGFYLGCNENNLRTFGYKAYQDFLGKKAHDLVAKEYADAVEKVDKEVMSSGKGKILEENGVNFKSEAVTFLTHKIPLFDDNHNIIGLLGVSFDITERKKMELELKATKELAEQQSKITHIYLNNLVASLPENFYWVDKESRVLGCNENQANILGLTSTQLTGKNVHDLAKILGWEEHIADTIKENDLEVMQTRQTKKTEEFILLNGEKRTFLSYKYPMIDDKDEVIGVFGVGIDISERKHMEEELLKAKEEIEIANIINMELIRNLDRDVRIPLLNGILKFINQLLQQETDLTKREFLSAIMHHNRKLLESCNESNVIKLY